MLLADTVVEVVICWTQYQIYNKGYHISKVDPFTGTITIENHE